MIFLYIGYRRRRGDGSDTFLRVDDPRYHFLLQFRRPGGDRAHLQTLLHRLASRRRRVRGERLHPPGDEAPSQRDRIRRFL